VPQSS